MALKEEEYISKAIPDGEINPVIPEFNQMQGKIFEIVFNTAFYRSPNPVAPPPHTAE